MELDLEAIRRSSAEPGAMFGAIIVRDLVSRLEQVERELVAVKSTQVQHIVTSSFETARATGIALDEAVKLVAGWLVDDPDKRAREAEQAVERVREVIHQYDPDCLTCMCNSDGDCCKCTVADFQEALDGDGRA